VIRRICLGLLLAAAMPLAAQRPMPAGTTIKANGIDLHYREMGSGEPLLLIHGFGSCGKESWSPFVDELAKNHRLIIVDQRGHGGSTGEDRFTHRQSANDMLALLDHLKLPRVKAMGISSGGMTLYHVATMAPDRIDMLVTIGATDEFGPQAREMLGMVKAQGLPPEVEQEFKTCSPRGESQVRGLIKTFGDFSTSTDDMNLKASDFAKLKARTLIIHGDRDIFFPVTVPTRIYGSIKDARLWVVPNGDHVPIYGEHRDDFLRIVQAFLKPKDQPRPR
jgi:pimeloyl-ACP methyl ester carboxylesterase